MSPRRPARKPGDPTIRKELAKLDRKNADDLRALKLPVEREPVTVFRAKP